MQSTATKYGLPPKMEAATSTFGNKASIKNISQKEMETTLTFSDLISSFGCQPQVSNNLYATKLLCEQASYGDYQSLNATKTSSKGCQAITKTGKNCLFRRSKDSHLCGLHITLETRCTAATLSKRRCRNLVKKESGMVFNMCTAHIKMKAAMSSRRVTIAESDTNLESQRDSGDLRFSEYNSYKEKDGNTKCDSDTNRTINTEQECNAKLDNNEDSNSNAECDSGAERHSNSECDSDSVD